MQCKIMGKDFGKERAKRKGAAGMQSGSLSPVFHPSALDDSTRRQLDEPCTECRRIAGALFSRPPLPEHSPFGVRCLFQRGFVGSSIRRVVETGPTSRRPALAELLLHLHLHLEEPVSRRIEVGDIRHIGPRLRRIGRFRAEDAVLALRLLCG